MNLYKAGELDYLGDTAAAARRVPGAALGEEGLPAQRLPRGLLVRAQHPEATPRRRAGAARARPRPRQAADRRPRGPRGQPPGDALRARLHRRGLRRAGRGRPGGGARSVRAGRGFDPGAARALLAEAGYAPVRDGDGWRAPGVPAARASSTTTARATGSSRSPCRPCGRTNLGVTARLRTEEWKVMLKSYRDGDFEVMRYGQTADYDHPQTFLAPFLAESPQNHTGWGDGAFDETMRRAAARGRSRGEHPPLPRGRAHRRRRRAAHPALLLHARDPGEAVGQGLPRQQAQPARDPVPARRSRPWRPARPTRPPSCRPSCLRPDASRP